MKHQINPALANCKVVFARNLENLAVSQGCVVFNAHRPLLGAEHPCKEWCHGRIYAEVNLADSFASKFIQMNNDLDARLVVPVTDDEVVEMLLVGSKYRERYDEHSIEEKLEMLLPNLNKIQSLPYGAAMALLDAAQAAITTDRASVTQGLDLPTGFEASITLNVFLAWAETDEEVAFRGSLSEAASMRGRDIEIYKDRDGCPTLSPVPTTPGEQATVQFVSYRLDLTGDSEVLSLGTFTDPRVMVSAAHRLRSRLGQCS